MASMNAPATTTLTASAALVLVSLCSRSYTFGAELGGHRDVYRALHRLRDLGLAVTCTEPGDFSLLRRPRRKHYVPTEAGRALAERFLTQVRRCADGDLPQLAQLALATPGQESP